MNFDEYQKKASTTAVYPLVGQNPFYPILGLVNEAGEVAGKLKKAIRDDNNNIENMGDFEITSDRLELLKGELGDVMWYLAATCTELGLTMEDVAQGNIEKLFSRKERGTLQGDGDKR